MPEELDFMPNEAQKASVRALRMQARVPKKPSLLESIENPKNLEVYLREKKIAEDALLAARALIDKEMGIRRASHH